MRNLLILLMIFIPNILLGQEQSIEKALKYYFKELIKVECKYKQEKELSMINKPLISTGVFRYEKGGSVVWEQETPFKQIYLINEKSNNKFDKYINQFIMSILTGDILDNKKLEVLYSENKDRYTIIMTPKKGAMKKKIKEINITFRKKAISLSRLEIILQNSDVTKINFYDN